MKLVAFTLLMAVAVRAKKPREGPVVGVLAQEPSPDMPPVNWTSYIAAGYVKAVEAAGARVVPIHIRQPDHYYTELLSKLNGVVLPGGSAPFDSPDGYSRVANIVFKHSMQMKMAGDHFPVLAVCLGMETLAYISNNFSSPLMDCKVASENLRLRFKPGYTHSSLFSAAYPQDLEVLRTLPSTSNHHMFCLTESNMTKMGLDKAWKVLATSRSKAGDEFVAVVEMPGYPIAGVQFHPEKTAYEWNPDQHNPHGRKAIMANRVFYDWLVGEARKNSHRFSTSEEEMEASISNYCPVFTARVGAYSDLLYEFYQS